MKRTSAGDQDGASFSLDELARATGVSIYQVRHWVRRGWLHPAYRSGSHPRYADDHVERVRAVVALRTAKKRSHEIDAFVREATRDDIRRTIGLAPLVPSTPEPPPRPETAPAPEQDRAFAETMRRASVDALVCLAAEQLDRSPRGLRLPLARVLRQLRALRLDVEEVARVLEEGAED